MFKIKEYTDALQQYQSTKVDSVLYPISDYIDTLNHADRIEFREMIKARGLGILPNLTYDYTLQKWITLPNGKLWK